MALITCPECGREVSDKAAACPYCGNPLKENPETEMSTKVDAVSAAQKKNYLKYSLLLWDAPIQMLMWRGFLRT